MIDTTATQQRKNLHGAIWAIADDLRGSVDGWDFKSYVFGHDVLPLHFRKSDELHQQK